jgi:hypothetical protein
MSSSYAGGWETSECGEALDKRKYLNRARNSSNALNMAQDYFQSRQAN